MTATIVLGEFDPNDPEMTEPWDDYCVSGRWAAADALKGES